MTSFDLANNAAYDNTITVGTRSGALASVFSYASCTSTQAAPYLNGSKNLTFSRNTYSVPSVNGWYWLWDGFRYWNSGSHSGRISTALFLNSISETSMLSARP